MESSNNLFTFHRGHILQFVVSDLYHIWAVAVREYDQRRGASLWGEAEIAAAGSVLRAGTMFRYADREGPGRVQELERLIVARAGGGHALATSSGTAALVCALVGLGVGPGQEVIVPAVTFLACVNAVAAVGAVPVFAEVDDSLTLDPASLDALVGPRTRAVMAVHLGNVAADLDPILEFAGRHGLRVLEDAAQAVGVTYRGVAVGAIGDAGIYSFNDEKNVATGEGGALLTADPGVHARALAYHDQGGQFSIFKGNVREHDATEPFLGQNFRMTEMAAAIAMVQFERLDAMLARLRGAARLVRASAGSGVQWRRIPDPEGEGGDLTMLLPSRRAALLRVRALRAHGIPGTLVYGGAPVYANAAVRAGRTAWGMAWSEPARCPRSERLVGGAVSVPLGASLSEDDVEALARGVADAIRDA
jgi:8-amino-3,8-dideoxy-alpha-D-manno-octulosonate transaminase